VTPTWRIDQVGPCQRPQSRRRPENEYHSPEGRCIRSTFVDASKLRIIEPAGRLPKAEGNLSDRKLILPIRTAKPDKYERLAG